MPFLFFKGKNFIRLNLATVNCFSHYVGWQQEKKWSNRKNISCMIEIYQGEITGFVKQNKITAIVNAASPTLMGSKVKSVDKSIHDFIDKSMPKGDRFKDRIKKQLDKTANLPDTIVRCKRGETVVTSGYTLCDYVIHVVGIRYDGERLNSSEKEKVILDVSSSCVGKLEKCYDEIINTVRKYPDITTVAIPLISAGNYGFPFELAFKIAIVSLGNALLRWRNEDPEMFERAQLKKIYVCVKTDGKTKQEEVIRKTSEIYKAIFSNNQKATYQSSVEAHIRFWYEIIRYDGLRGYFAVAKMFRLVLLLLRTIFLPVVCLKDFIGGNNWQRRRTVVEITAIIKLFLPLIIAFAIPSMVLQSEAILMDITKYVIIYFMTDTLTYLLSLIVFADIQRPSANVIRSMIFLLINYIEVSLDIALLHYMSSPDVESFSIALQFGILPETFSVEQCTAQLLYLNYGVKFFFMTLAFGYFANHLRQRKFSS